MGDNFFTAEFWEYQSTLGRRWNLDPKPQVHVSDYSCLENNPIANLDLKGDTKQSRHLDPTGKIIAEYNDGDNTVFKHQTATSKTEVDFWRNKFNNTSGNGINFGAMSQIGFGVWNLNTMFKDETNTSVYNFNNEPEQENKSTETNWYAPSSKANVFLGAGASALEKTSGSIRLKTTNTVFNPKYHPNAWKRNQYAKTYNISKAGNIFSRVFFIFGLAIDVRGVMIYNNNPKSANAVSLTKLGVNTGMGICGLYINPIPTVLYFGIDAFYPGGMDSALINNALLEKKNQAIL